MIEIGKKYYIDTRFAKKSDVYCGGILLNSSVYKESIGRKVTAVRRLQGDRRVEIAFRNYRYVVLEDVLVEKKPKITKTKKQFECFCCGKNVKEVPSKLFPVSVCYTCEEYIRNSEKYFDRAIDVPEFTEEIDPVIGSSRLFGAEIEVTASNKEIEKDLLTMKLLSQLLKRIQGVHLEHDGTLPRYSGGEIVTHPRKGKSGYEFLVFLNGLLNRLSITVNDSCGLHVHIDARDFQNNIEKIKKVFLFYFLMEDVFNSLVPNKRRGSDYARSFRKYTNIKDIKQITSLSDIDRILYRTEDDEIIDALKHDKRGGGTRGGHNYGRYLYINLHSIYYRGTIEIRSHEGTTSAKDIIAWTSLHAKCMDFINRVSIKEIEDFYNSVDSLESVLKKKNIKKLTKKLFEEIDLSQEFREHFYKRQLKFRFPVDESLCRKNRIGKDVMQEIVYQYFNPFF